ncbi:tetratricopeptide repeat protein [Nocardiopsis alba]|jgi:TPR repeat protein|uniref:tetratricopeptide repeat protein n=1 Tax=Nocardiopsis alba TaxID=53437 RepID=UPI0033AE4686
MVDNRMGDVYGTAFQAGVIHSVTVNAPPTAPIPGWVGMALPVHRCDPGELGVHNTLSGPDDAGIPPYVARDVDGELDRRLASVAAAARGGLVLVTGASTAGKTRALTAALGRTLPDRMLVAPPEDADLRPLPAWLAERAAQAPQGWVIWLDDLDRHLGSSGLTPTLVAELGQAGAIVAATIRRNRLEALRPSTTDHASASEGSGYAVLKTPPVVIERRWNPQERERARASGDERLVEAAADERFGVAERLTAGPLLESVWLGGPDSGSPRGHALVAAAVGLAAAGVSSALTREQIQAAHGAYLPAPPPLPEEDDQAWEWATRQRSGLAGLLVPVDHEGHRWRAFDYLTAQEPLPDAMWRSALETATVHERYDVGVTASSADRADVAEAAFLPLAEMGHPGAMNSLGILLYEEGRTEKAVIWLRRAADQGDTSSMFNLGILLNEAGRTEEAATWYRRASDHGHINSMFNFGSLLNDAGLKEEAEAWFHRAAEQGHTDAMFNFAFLLNEAGRDGEIEGWFRRAADQGHTGAMNSLGTLLTETGRAEEAEAWYRRAIDRGNTGTMSNLGNLLKEAGRTEEAESWYRRGADQGHVEATYNLGRLLHEAGRLEDAVTWYVRAADQGLPEAMNSLGTLLTEADLAEEAEAWYLRAVDQGHVGAMHSLGVLLSRADRMEEAVTWYLRAAEHDHAGSMSNLGNLLKEAGLAEEAESWYLRAARLGHTNAMVNLAILLYEAGRDGECEDWFRRAAAQGHTTAMANLGALLTEAGRTKEAEFWLHRARME